MTAWLLSKLGGLAAAVLGLLALLLGYRWQKFKRRLAETRADGLEAELEHRRKTEAVDAETDKAKEKLDVAAQDGGLLAYFRDGRLLRRDTKGGAS
jgi:threonine aldolase